MSRGGSYRDEESIAAVIGGKTITWMMVRRMVGLVVALGFVWLVWMMLNDLLTALYGLWAFSTWAMAQAAWVMLGRIVPAVRRNPQGVYLAVVVVLASAAICAVVVAHVIVACYVHRGVCS